MSITGSVAEAGANSINQRRLGPPEDRLGLPPQRMQTTMAVAPGRKQTVYAGRVAYVQVGGVGQIPECVRSLRGK